MPEKKDLIYGKPASAMFSFALPMIIGNLFQQFYNITDSIIVGNFVGENALAAVGASYSFTTVFIMIAIGSGMGASVLVSQYFGARKYKEMKTAISTFLITVVLFSVLLSCIGFVISPFVLRALKTPANILNESVLYLQIYFIGLPFMFMYNVLSANFNALGKSKIPLYLLIFSSILNIILDVWFVIDFEGGVAGVAVATVIAQSISCIISFFLLSRYLKTFSTDMPSMPFDKNMLKNEIRIAFPSIIQQSIVSVGMLLTQSAVNPFGSSVVAGYSAGNRLESICIVPMIAIGNAMSTFTAQNFGAGRVARIKEGYHAALRLIIGFSILIVGGIQLYYAPLVSAFINAKDSATAFQTGVNYLRFISWFFVILGFKTTTDGILRGAGDVKIYMFANLVNLIIRVAVAHIGAPLCGVEIVWYIIPVGWFANFLISYIWYRTGNWKKQKEM